MDEYMILPQIRSTTIDSWFLEHVADYPRIDSCFLERLVDYPHMASFVVVVTNFFVKC